MVIKEQVHLVCLEKQEGILTKVDKSDLGKCSKRLREVAGPITTSDYGESPPGQWKCGCFEGPYLSMYDMGLTCIGHSTHIALLDRVESKAICLINSSPRIEYFETYKMKNS
ncbi:hypothetical protein E2C01_010846 [Portunus trituberculatus]|uniref:Uncharacterized protein n=1 Tax=Portunus trituberculatus TaxID=210409 RepID=A0A5B7D9Z6_PORTR|nr:hypothetical protein [Portunus trituberculatus]